MAQLVANGMDGAVGWRIDGRRFGWVTGVGAEVMVAADSAASFRHREIGGVAIDVEDHVAGVITERGVGMGGAVVEYLDDGFGGVVGAFGLFGGKRVERNKECDVDGAGVI